MAPHELGMLGEFLNLIGALVLALDLFYRERERDREKKWSHIAEFGRANDLNRTEYKGLRITSPDFTSNLSDRRAAFIGYVGMAFLVLGFLLLIGYHWEELQTQTTEPDKHVSVLDDNHPPNFRN